MVKVRELKLMFAISHLIESFTDNRLVDHYDLTLSMKSEMGIKQDLTISSNDKQQFPQLYPFHLKKRFQDQLPQATEFDEINLTSTARSTQSI